MNATNPPLTIRCTLSAGRANDAEAVHAALVALCPVGSAVEVAQSDSAHDSISITGVRRRLFSVAFLETVIADARSN